jgi:hypothetical protein
MDGEIIDSLIKFYNFIVNEYLLRLIKLSLRALYPVPNDSFLARSLDNREVYWVFILVKFKDFSQFLSLFLIIRQL